MKTQALEFVLCAAVAACLVGCDDGSDDAASGCCGGYENQDLTAYEDDVSALLEHTFSGTIEDDGADIPCRFDGALFELYLEVAPPSSWSCTDYEDGKPADCTNAAVAVLPLEGQLEIDTGYQLTGSAALFSNCDLSVIFTADIPCYQNGLGDGMLDCLFFDSSISQINWVISNDEEHTEGWELCMLNVDSID